MVKSLQHGCYVLVALAAICGIQPAKASQWVSGGDRFYVSGSNWSTVGPPSATDDAEFLGLIDNVLWGHPFIPDGMTQSRNLTVANGGFTFTPLFEASFHQHTVGRQVRIENGTLNLGSSNRPMNLIVVPDSIPNAFSYGVLLDDGSLNVLHGSNAAAAVVDIEGLSSLRVSGSGSQLETYAIDRPAPSDRVRISGPTFFNDGPPSLMVSNFGFVQTGSLEIAGDNAGGSGEVRLNSNSAVEAGRVSVGRQFSGAQGAGHFGILDVGFDGTGAFLQTAAVTTFTVGNRLSDSQAVGQVMVRNGAEIRTGSAINGGFLVNQTGSVTVESGGKLGFRQDAFEPKMIVDGGSIWFQSGSTTGFFGNTDTLLRVENGGNFNLDFGINFQGGIRLEAETGGRFQITGGAAIGSGSSGTLSVDGGTFFSRGGGGFAVGDSGTVNLSSGTIDVDIFSDNLGGAFNHRGGEVIVDGGSFNTNATTYILGNTTATSRTTLTLRNGATSMLPGVGAISGAFGADLNVESGSSFASTGSLFIGGAEGDGAARVIGSGSSLASSIDLEVGEKTNGELFIGAGAAASGQLVRLGRFAGGNGTIQVAGQLTADSAIEIGSSGAGEVILEGGTATVATGGITIGANGQLTGVGQLEVGTQVVNNGVVAPGSLGGSSISIEGDYQQGTGGRLEIDLSALNSDTLNVSGNVLLGGELVVTLNDGNAPGVGTRVDLVLAGSSGGLFNNVTFPDTEPETNWVIAYTPTGVSIFSTPVLQGDYNADGVVDAADYTVWRDTVGETYELAADGNFDLVVNELDLAIWRANYGATLGLAAIPEPSTAVLVVASLLAAGGWGQRRQP